MNSDLLALQEELACKTAELENIKQAGVLITSSLDIERILALLMELALSTVMAEVGAIILKHNRSISTAIAWGIDEKMIERVTWKSGKKVVETVLEEVTPVIIPDAAANEELQQIDEFEFIRSLMFVPLHSQDSVVGVLVVINKEDAEDSFNEVDLEMLSSLGGFASVAIENARLHIEELEKEKMEQELKVANRIQMGLLPDTPPSIDGVEMSGVCHPAKDVGGDYYDYLDLGDGCWGILIADVSSKGAPAALLMSMIRIVFRVIAREIRSPAEIVTKVNETIYDDMSGSSGMFVTLFLGVLDTKDMKLTYTNAGHCPTLVLRQPDADSPVELTELITEDLFVGFDSDIQYSQRTIQIEKGDLVVFYTDGVTDVLNAQEDVYGTQRFYEFLKGAWQKKLPELTKAVYDDVVKFSGTTAEIVSQYDDFTFVLLRYSGQTHATGEDLK